MKVKPRHIWRSGILTFDMGDVLCISVVFTWHLPLARRYADSMQHRKVRIGGPAVKLARHKIPGFFLGCSAELDGEIPGVLQRFNPQATRTSVGCIRQCAFCSVPLVEGADTLREFGRRQQALPDWPDLPVIADNNLLANEPSHVDRVCDRCSRRWIGAPSKTAGIAPCGAPSLCFLGITAATFLPSGV